MGFFRKILRGAGLAAPEPFVPASFPFSGEIRLRHQDYDRLTTGWWRVAVASPSEWDAKVQEMREGLRRHFGFYLTKDGRTVPRWNDRSWAGVLKRLVVEGR